MEGSNSPSVRYMEQTGGGWVVQCRPCPKRHGKRVYDTAKECHDFWREHVETDLHKKSLEAWDRNTPKVDPMAAFLAGLKDGQRLSR